MSAAGGFLEDAVRDEISEVLVGLVLQHGYPGTTEEMLCAAAGIDRVRLRKSFPDLEAVLLWAFDRRANHYAQALRAAHGTQGSWPDNLRAVAYQVAWWIRDNPRAVLLGYLVMSSAGELARARRDRVLMESADYIDEGRLQLDDPESISRSTAESILGAIVARHYRSVEANDGLDPMSQVPSYMYMAVRPYLGHDVAIRELAIPAPGQPPVPSEPERQGAPPT